MLYTLPLVMAIVTIVGQLLGAQTIVLHAIFWLLAAQGRLMGPALR